MPKALDWKLVDSSPFYRDDWISIRSNSYELPDGRLVAPCFILEYDDWINVIAITRDRQVVLERQFRYGIGQTILEIPGGVTEPSDSSLLEAAQRELLEETGYASQNWLATGSVCPNPGLQNNWMHCFLALDAEKVAEPRLDETEHIEVLLMPLEDMIQRAVNGEFFQSLHVSALFFALAKLGRIG